MLFSQELHDYEVPGLVDSFTAITGLADWTGCNTSLKKKIKQNPFLHDYLHQFYELEIEFARLWQEKSRKGRVLAPGWRAQRYRLLAFMTTVVRTHSRLSDAGRNRLRGMLLSGLRGEGLSSLSHEMTTAAHLMSKGFDVHFSDIDTGAGGFDFLATKPGIEIEVECKRIGVSLGRKIPRYEVLCLHKRIHKEMELLLPKISCGLVVRVILPARLHISDGAQKAVESRLASSLRTGVEPEDNLDCKIILKSFPMEGTPFADATVTGDIDGMRTFLDEQYGIKNREIAIAGSSRAAISVSIESEQSDTFMDSLFSDLSEAASRQFSGTRPGILSVKFIDLTSEQIARISSATPREGEAKQPSYLLMETSRFLASESRRHVLGIGYLGQGELTRGNERIGYEQTSTTTERGNVFYVHNEMHSLYGNREYSPFVDV